LQDVELCLQYFQTCVLMSTGTHCGIARRTAECDGEIVDGPSDCYQDDAYCTELDSGACCTGDATPMCPPHFESVDICPGPERFGCYGYSESLFCQLVTVSPDECGAAGGELFADPGDGSRSSQGCPDDRTTLGWVDPGSIEGTLCCAL
jgi:hypothetical protein